MPVIESYRTKDGAAVFSFGFVQEETYWRIDIQQSPYLGSADGANLHNTHRLSSSAARSGYQICFAEPTEVSSLRKAHEFAEFGPRRSGSGSRPGAELTVSDRGKRHASTE